jgi:homoserine dehydrogenase
VRIDGIINGTTNTVLELVAGGLPFDEAVRSAQRSGLAEADPSRDLEGLDVADKLVILARQAWGATITPEQVRRTPLTRETLAEATAAAAATEVVRYVATLEHTPAGIVARVAPTAVDPSHPLARVRNEWNALIVSTQSAFHARVQLVRGKGAGRWPTAEAVVADALDLAAADPAQNVPAGTESGNAEERRRVALVA